MQDHTDRFLNETPRDSAAEIFYLDRPRHSVPWHVSMTIHSIRRVEDAEQARSAYEFRVQESGEVFDVLHRGERFAVVECERNGEGRGAGIRATVHIDDDSWSADANSVKQRLPTAWNVDVAVGEYDGDV